MKALRFWGWAILVVLLVSVMALVVDDRVNVFAYLATALTQIGIPSTPWGVLAAGVVLMIVLWWLDLSLSQRRWREEARAKDQQRRALVTRSLWQEIPPPARSEPARSSTESPATRDSTDDGGLGLLLHASLFSAAMQDSNPPDDPASTDNGSDPQDHDSSSSDTGSSGYDSDDISSSGGWGSDSSDIGSSGDGGGFDGGGVD